MVSTKSLKIGEGRNAISKSPVQDPEKRQQLIASLGAARLSELIALVPAEIEKVCVVLESTKGGADGAPPAKTFAALEMEAHGLKGVAVNYGLLRLAECATALQDYCRTHADIDLHLRRLQECAVELTELGD